MAIVVPDPLRIVCTRCPANATVRLQRVLPVEDALLVWCECHGEHVIAYISGETLRACLAEPHPLIMQLLCALSEDEVQDRRDRAERDMLGAVAWVDALDAFLAGRPK